MQPYFHSRASSGLSSPTFVDWPTLGAKEMTAITPEVVVFIISTNDYPVALVKTLDANGELAWKAQYTKEVDDMMKVLEASGRTVLWLGAPVLGDTKQNDAIKELNAVEKEVAKKHPGIEYFDTYALFADADGKYTATVTDADGKTITARSGDGIHFTMDGANYLATRCSSVIDVQCKVAAQAVTGETKATIQNRGARRSRPAARIRAATSARRRPRPATTTPRHTSPSTAEQPAAGRPHRRPRRPRPPTDRPQPTTPRPGRSRTHRPERDAPAGPSVSFAHA